MATSNFSSIDAGGISRFRRWYNQFKATRGVEPPKYLVDSFLQSEIEAKIARSDSSRALTLQQENAEQQQKNYEKSLSVNEDQYNKSLELRRQEMEKQAQANAASGMIQTGLVGVMGAPYLKQGYNAVKDFVSPAKGAALPETTGAGSSGNFNAGTTGLKWNSQSDAMPGLGGKISSGGAAAPSSAAYGGDFLTFNPQSSAVSSGAAAPAASLGYNAAQTGWNAGQASAVGWNTGNSAIGWGATEASMPGVGAGISSGSQAAAAGASSTGSGVPVGVFGAAAVGAAVGGQFGGGESEKAAATVGGATLGGFAYGGPVGAAVGFIFGVGSLAVSKLSYLCTATSKAVGLSRDDSMTLRKFKVYAGRKHRAVLDFYLKIGQELVDAINSGVDQKEFYKVLKEEMIIPVVDYMEFGDPESAYQIYKDNTWDLIDRYLPNRVDEKNRIESADETLEMGVM